VRSGVSFSLRAQTDSMGRTRAGSSTRFRRCYPRWNLSSDRTCCRQFHDVVATVVAGSSKCDQSIWLLINLTEVGLSYIREAGRARHSERFRGLGSSGINARVCVLPPVEKVR